MVKRVILYGVLTLASCSHGTSGGGPVGGNQAACVTYRNHAGDIEAGAMSQSSAAAWASSILSNADDSALKTAASSLVTDIQNATLPIENDGQLVTDQESVLAACGSLGF